MNLIREYYFKNDGVIELRGIGQSKVHSMVSRNIACRTQHVNSWPDRVNSHITLEKPYVMVLQKHACCTASR
jgi:hypothetical protein